MSLGGFLYLAGSAVGWAKARLRRAHHLISHASMVGTPTGRYASGRFAHPTHPHKLRSTVAGFWFSATRVPARPRPTVTVSAATTTPAALPACQTKLSVISRVTISHAATEPANTPNTAVATPIIRYSSA